MMAKNEPIMPSHQGAAEGMTQVSRTPVTTAERSPTLVFFFMSLR